MSINDNYWLPFYYDDRFIAEWIAKGERFNLEYFDDYRELKEMVKNSYSIYLRWKKENPKLARQRLLEATHDTIKEFLEKEIF
jgi:ABC-type ATPase with predicted acetyltransferase domain